MDDIGNPDPKRALLSAILLQALKDAKGTGCEGTEARRWIIDVASSITRSLYGFDVDGMFLLKLLDQGDLDHIIRYKSQRYRRPVTHTHRYKVRCLDPIVAEILLITCRA